MTRTARSADRPLPVFRQCDGAPWPTENELDLDAAWAAFRESADEQNGTDGIASTDSPSTADGRLDHERASEQEALDAALWHPDDYANPLSDTVAGAADLDARLGHLECVVRDRQRATADEYRLILTILDDAAFDPTPWVGPDPTVDRAWKDPRGRTPRVVRRDRIDLAERAAVAEIAVRLRLSEQTVRTRAAHARTLAEGCPRLWAAFGDGRLSEKHAVDAARLASTLPAGDTDAFERFDEHACPQALILPPAKFAVAARVIRERVHAESIEARHRRAAHDRAVWMTAELDGMASIHALLPADRARAVMSRLDRAARHLRVAPDEERTLLQLRADAFADLVTMTETPPTHTSAPPPPSDAAIAEAADGNGATSDPAGPKLLRSAGADERRAEPALRARIPTPPLAPRLMHSKLSTRPLQPTRLAPSAPLRRPPSSSRSPRSRSSATTPSPPRSRATDRSISTRLVDWRAPRHRGSDSSPTP